MNGGSDKCPPKAVAPMGVEGMLLRKIFNFRASKMQFPVFSGAICSGLAELVHFFLTTHLFSFLRPV